MQRIIIISGLILLNAANAFSQRDLPENVKLASVCELWGFLKYYHPVIAKGKLDWDKELIKHIKLVNTAGNKQELSIIYVNWINSLGKIKPCVRCRKTMAPDSLKFNLDLSWIDNRDLFTDSLATLLKYIEENRNQGENYYVKKGHDAETLYENEKPYKDSIFPGPECRLLSLFRYWNIINYFFPYKYVIGEGWEKVLLEMIPRFEYARDTLSYHLAMLELITKTNDSHASLRGSPFIEKFYGDKFVPFRYSIAENKVIVTGIRNPLLAKADDIRQNDVFLRINNKTIPEIVDEWSKYLCASNYSVKLRKAAGFIFSGNMDSIQVTCQRKDSIFTKTIHTCIYENIRYSFPHGNDVVFKIIDNNIGYVNLGILKIKDVENTMSALKNTKAIIFDIRNYPLGTLYKIATFLNRKSEPFAEFTSAQINYPGVFKYSRPYFCGKSNKNPYKGKVILLFNETTQSHGEYTCMALQTAANVTCIGSQTAGADGNITAITFPGGYQTWMTGIGVYYPDGRKTQRIGIVPDIEVKPTIKGIQEGRDELLEKAIEICGKL